MSSFGAALFGLGLGLVVYVYVGYPSILALLARLRANHSPVTDEHLLPSITILIAAYNEEAVIARKLDSVLELDYPSDRLQILVAADGSTDRTVEIVGRYERQGIDLAFLPARKGKTAAITRAMAQVRGEIVVFSDANNRYQTDALRHLVGPFADPSVGIVGGAKVIEEGDGSLGASEGAYWRYEHAIKQHESALGSTVAVCGEILALRTELFRAPPDGVINDDFWLAVDILQRGYRVLYAPSARSVERVSATLGDEMARRSRIVAGRFQAFGYLRARLLRTRPRVAWSLISHKLMRPLVPFAMVAMLLGNLLWLVGGDVLPWTTALIQATVYLVAWLVDDASEMSSLGVAGTALYAVSFLVRANVAALRGFVDLLGGRQSAAWRRVVRRGE